jgi:hypothetical protein
MTDIFTFELVEHILTFLISVQTLRIYTNDAKNFQQSRECVTKFYFCIVTTYYSSFYFDIVPLTSVVLSVTHKKTCMYNVHIMQEKDQSLMKTKFVHLVKVVMKFDSSSQLNN